MQYERLMQRDGMVREFEYQVRRRDGSILWLSDSATVVRDEAGEIGHSPSADTHDRVGPSDPGSC